MATSCRIAWKCVLVLEKIMPRTGLDACACQMNRWKCMILSLTTKPTYVICPDHYTNSQKANSFMPRMLLCIGIWNFPNSSSFSIVVWSVSNTLNSGTRVKPLKCSALTMLSYVTSKGSSVSESAEVGEWRCRRCIAVNMNSIWTLLWSLMATLPRLNWLWDVTAAFSHMSLSPIQSWSFFKISSHLRKKRE